MTVIVCLAAASIIGKANAATWNVYPDGHGTTPTIQSAIDSAAAAGDGIRVWGGTYYEADLVVEGKSILLQAYEGVAVVISPIPGAGTGVTLRQVGSGFILMGLEMRDFAAGIAVEDCSPTVWYCALVGCGTGISVAGGSSAPMMTNCLVEGCATGVSVGGGTGTLVGNMTIVGCGIGIETTGGAVTWRRNIIDSCDTGALCSGGSPALSCNDVYLCDIPYSGCAAGAGDISAMPRFCFDAGSPANPYLLHIDSPCWASNNDCGVNMGAFTQIHGCEGTPVEESTWGAIKKLHR
ncbi:MAG: right-handed parallel beta-helix repeat-containing protein [Candidatus Krumholzibacteria bacterium]|nr:right-handed parallel beta-helix repeat-containing protein [Candidatus Krumholzibacteria bacterium]